MAQIATDFNEFRSDTQAIIWGDGVQTNRAGDIFTGTQVDVAQDNFIGREKPYAKLVGLDLFIF